MDGGPMAAFPQVLRERFVLADMLRQLDMSYPALTRWLPTATLVSAAVAIVASLGAAPFVVLTIFKPLTTVLILVRPTWCEGGIEPPPLAGRPEGRSP